MLVKHKNKWKGTWREMPWGCCRVARWDFRTPKQEIAHGHCPRWGQLPTIRQVYFWYASLLLRASSLSIATSNEKTIPATQSDTLYRAGSLPSIGIFLISIQLLHSCNLVITGSLWIDTTVGHLVWLDWTLYLSVLLWTLSQSVLIHPSNQAPAQNLNLWVLFVLEGNCALSYTSLPLTCVYSYAQLSPLL